MKNSQPQPPQCVWYSLLLLTDDTRALCTFPALYSRPAEPFRLVLLQYILYIARTVYIRQGLLMPGGTLQTGA